MAKKSATTVIPRSSKEFRDYVRHVILYYEYMNWDWLCVVAFLAWTWREVNGQAEVLS